MTMKFSIFAITALATATCSSCFVSATAAAARKRKITKKEGSLSGSYGVTGPTVGDIIPIGDTCMNSDDCDAQSCRVWIAGSVEVVNATQIYTENHHIAKAMYAKADNRVHRAESPLTVSSHWVWITQFVAMESVNGEYSVQFFLQFIQCGSTCKTNLHTAFHIFFLSL